MRRLMAKKVFSGLVTAWRFAAWPTSRSPESVKATCEGVVRAPSAFSMTLASLPSMTATQEFVVPRSIPITLLIVPHLISESLVGLPMKHQPDPCDNIPASKPGNYGGKAFRLGDI